MLEKLIEAALAHRFVVLALTLVCSIAGALSLARLPMDAYPDTTPVQVTVNTSAPALSPVEIERQITAPLEQSISGLPGLTQVRSISKFGLSQIVATFKDDTELYLARQVVSERLQSVTLAQGVEPPSLGPVSTGLGEVFQYVLKSETLSLSELRTLHHWIVRPQLLQVPGVAEINTWGGEELQYHVIFEPDRLLKYELTLDDVARALRRNNANVSGGILSRAGAATLVQGASLLKDEAQIAQVVIAARDGVPVKISDVAQVRADHEVRRGAVTSQGRGEVVLGLGFMLVGENSRVLTERLERRLEQAKRSLPPQVEVVPVYSRTKLVDQVMDTVRDNLLEGALLVIAVLFIFLGELRAGLIVALAIPLSMLFAFNGMLRFGVAGSLMSLGALDFGLVVDSSVIMVEHASRKLQEDRSSRSVLEIIKEAAIEVRRPTLFGELIIAVVYLPILALEGVEGKLFKPMALTVIFALFGSMLLSMTVTPVLASLLLKRPKPGASHEPPRVVRAMSYLYAPILSWAMRHRGLVIVASLLLMGNAAFLASRLGTNFIPILREQAIAINTVRLASVSLEESVRYGTQLELLLLARFPDEIEHIWTRTGSGEVATDPMGLEVSDVFMTLRPRGQWTRAKTQDELMAQMDAALEGMPGMRAIFSQPIEMRMNEMTSGLRADVGVKIFGDDLELLRDQADALRQIIESIPGAADVSVEQLTGSPTLRVEVDQEALSRFGIAAEEVLELVEALGTPKVGEIIQGQRRFALVLRLDDRYRQAPERLGRLWVSAPSGQRVMLSQLAKITTVEGPSTITREWARRRITVQVNVKDRGLREFVQQLRARVDAELKLPPGYVIEYGGQLEHLERARARLVIVIPLALMLVVMLLYISLGRTRDVVMVFTGVPFAAVGGVLALWARGLPLSISAAVGFIAVSGVAVLGQLVLVSRLRDLQDTGVALEVATRQAATERLRPVLMTGLVAALGFVPMALNTGIGAEVQRPLATVVIGGVLTSMLATLMLLPALSMIFGDRSNDSPTADEPDEQELA